MRKGKQIDRYKACPRVFTIPELATVGHVEENAARPADVEFTDTSLRLSNNQT